MHPNKKKKNILLKVATLSVFIGVAIVELLTSFFLPAPLFYKINVTTLGREYMLSSNKTLIYEPKPGGGEFNKHGYRGKEFTCKRNEKKRIKSAENANPVSSTKSLES